jgi:uncharacterized protein (DUF1778 family)
MPNAPMPAARARARARPKKGHRTLAKPRAKARPKRKPARLEARIRPELQALIRRAADLEGRKVTEFVTTALQTAAQRAIAESQVVRLATADQLRFAQAVIAPPAPTPALKRAFVRRRALVAES